MIDKEVACPYCSSLFQDRKEMSRHIDRIHNGSGLLEGNTSRQ